MDVTPMIQGVSKFLHGGDYNPDQWFDEPGVIDEDFRLLKLSGCNALSVGIFSWAALEPERGRFEFDWLREILDRIHAAGAMAVLATPSAGKPAWLAEDYPEVRRVNKDGLRQPQWMRHNHCPTSPVYRKYVHRVDEALARAFGSHPAVVLWHIGNEFSGECYCDLCRQAFRDWLRDRYGSLDELNRAWVKAFWGHTVNRWSQVGPDDPTHDAQVLDWRRFVSQQHVDFVRMEIETVRRHAPHRPVTTNMMGTHAGIDYFRLAEPLEVISNDSYPQYHDRTDPQANIDMACNAAFSHDLMRSLAGGRPFLQMESAPSATNWMEVHKLKRPGIHRMEMLQAIAHGADGTMYFQWRKSRGACEKFHGAVVDHVGHEQTRVFNDIRDHSKLLDAIQPVLASRVKTDVAIMMDWETRWAIEASQGPGKSSTNKDKGYLSTLRTCHRILWERGIAADFVNRRSDLSGYRLLIMPMAYLLEEADAERIASFVEGGGTAVASWLTGIVDGNNRCHLGGWPGAGLRDVFGMWVEEWDQLYNDDEQSAVPAGQGADLLPRRYPLTGLCDQIHAAGADVLATYGHQFYAGSPVITRNRLGRGQAIYVGANGGVDLWRDLLGGLLREQSIEPPIPAELPEGVSICLRQGGSDRFLFVLNVLGREQEVPLGEQTFTDMETGQRAGGRVALGPYGSVVLRQTAATGHPAGDSGGQTD